MITKRVDSLKKSVDFITRAFLMVLATGGVLTVSAITPGLLPIIKRFICSRHQKYYLKNLPHKLAKQGLVAMKQVGDEVEIHLTKRGRAKVLKYKFDELKLPISKRWDGKWRVIISDIPDKRKVARNRFRQKILELGMYRLQKSVWVYPYDCEDEIDFIKEIYEIRPFVRYMVVDYLDRESDIKRFFGLKKQ